MAVTTQARNGSGVIADPDESKYEDEKQPLLRGCSTNSTDYGNSNSDSECESESSSELSDEVEKPCSSASSAEFDKRAMTPMQERFNAVTMLPGMIYTVYFCWLIVLYQQGKVRYDQSSVGSKWADIVAKGTSSVECNGIGVLLPPLTVLASALSNLVHSSCSMLYHWKYATTIAEPSKRIAHWSRRLDSASIHFASAFASYSTSGRVDYFVLNLLFNLDCGLRHFEEEVRPGRNLLRSGISILLYTLPVLVYGHYDLFAQFLIMFALCGWLFVRYPFGGWSHGMFHLVLNFLPYLGFNAAMQLESSRLHIALAATCNGK